MYEAYTANNVVHDKYCISFSSELWWPSKRNSARHINKIPFFFYIPIYIWFSFKMEQKVNALVLILFPAWQFLYRNLRMSRQLDVATACVSVCARPTDVRSIIHAQKIGVYIYIYRTLHERRLWWTCCVQSRKRITWIQNTRTNDQLSSVHSTSTCTHSFDTKIYEALAWLARRKTYSCWARNYVCFMWCPLMGFWIIKKNIWKWNLVFRAMSWYHKTRLNLIQFPFYFILIKSWFISVASTRENSFVATPKLSYTVAFCYISHV